MRTSKSVIDKRYEEKHKEERKAAHKVWGTSLERDFAEEIDVFLNKFKISKVTLIVAGYKALQNQCGPKTTE